MAGKTVTLAQLVSAALAAGLEIVEGGAVMTPAEARRSTRVKQGKKAPQKRSNTRLEYTEGHECPFCAAPYERTTQEDSKNGPRMRARFAGCKHTVNVY